MGMLGGSGERQGQLWNPDFFPELLLACLVLSFVGIVGKRLLHVRESWRQELGGVIRKVRSK